MDSVRPSGQHFSLDVALAAAYGIEEAFLIHHFIHWIRVNRDRGVNLHEGRTWSYQTLQHIADHFPFLDYQQVKYAIGRLEKLGILKKGNFNKDPMDKTTWYSFEDEELYVPFISRKSKNVYDSGNSLIDSGKPMMDSGNSPIYIGKILKSKDTKEPVVVVAHEQEIGPIEYITPKGESKSISESDVYLHFTRLPEFKDVVGLAIKLARKKPDGINDILRFIEGTCENILQTQKAKEVKKEEEQVKIDEKPKEKTVTLKDNPEMMKKLQDALQQKRNKQYV